MTKYEPMLKKSELLSVINNAALMNTDKVDLTKIRAKAQRFKVKQPQMVSKIK